MVESKIRYISKNVKSKDSIQYRSRATFEAYNRLPNATDLAKSKCYALALGVTVHNSALLCILQIVIRHRKGSSLQVKKGVF